MISSLFLSLTFKFLSINFKCYFLYFNIDLPYNVNEFSSRRRWFWNLYKHCFFFISARKRLNNLLQQLWLWNIAINSEFNENSNTYRKVTVEIVWLFLYINFLKCSPNVNLVNGICYLFICSYFCKNYSSKNNIQ